MKTLTRPRTDLQQEFSAESHILHHDALKEVASAIVQSIGIVPGQVTVLHGLEQVSGAPDYEISPGAIFYDGEVYLCDGINGNDGGNVPVLSIVQTAIGQPSKFSDFEDRQTHFERKAVIQFAATGSGISDYLDVVSAKSKLSELIELDTKLANLKNEILGGAGAQFDTLAELQAALGDDEDFAANVLAQIALKANKAQGAWTAIPMNAQYSVRLGMTPQYRVDQFGVVHLRGQISIDFNEAFITLAGAVPNPPTGTGGLVGFTVPYLESDGTTIGHVRIAISNTGQLSLPAGFPAANLNASFYLNGISYSTEAY